MRPDLDQCWRYIRKSTLCDSTSMVGRRRQTTVAHFSCCWNACHLDLWPCSDRSKLLSLITMLAKSVSSTKSEVMMLTPSIPGLWASTQDMMAGRFLQSQHKKDTQYHPLPTENATQNKTRKSEFVLSGDRQWHFLGSAKLEHLLSHWGLLTWHQCLFPSHASERYYSSKEATCKDEANTIIMWPAVV